MFKSMLGRVLEGLTNISPVKNLIKYIIDRSLNELLSDQISLEDFKNGELHLSNISLNLDKINKEYLLSSPYILHEGKVRRLKITLPGWSQISTKSIEVTAEGLQLDLKPNKQFYDNFKDAMRDQQMDIMQKEDPGEINEDNPMDFFRQLVKQIILNIRFRADNSVVRLFMNEPTKELGSNKPQYYLMFRVPLLTLGKSEQVFAQKEDEEQIRFDLIIPQMSLHLLRQNCEFPEYQNENASKGDFPFTYPPVSHPSTILVIGKLNDIQKVDCDLCTKLTITLTTLFKKQRKFFEIGGRISHFQSIIDPIQLKIFTRFFAQIMQFQKILKSVMAQMGLNSLATTLNRRDSKGKSGSTDLFSSLMMSISEPASKNASEGKLLNEMLQSKEMTQAAEEFNQSAAAQLRGSGELSKSGEWKNINFKQETIVKFQLGTFQVHFPKYVSITPYERRWSAEHKYEQVNESLGCSHYRLTLKGLSYSFSSVNNLHDVKMKFVKLQDARLTNIQAFHHSVSEEFYDLDSISFENTEIKQDYFTKRPELSVFRATKEQHYCMEELFRLSEGQQPQVVKSNIKTYAFIPAGAQCGEGAGLKLSFNGHIKELKVDIKDVAMMVNFQIWKDVLNIVYPVHLYRKLNEKINLQSSQMTQAQAQSPKTNDLLFESQYRFSGNLMQQVNQKQQKIEIKVKVGLVYCFYRETSALKSKQNLFEEVERKILDSDNFSKICFCNLNERGLYAEIHDLQWQQISEEFNLSIKEIKAGLLSVENSKVQADVIPILIADNLRVEESKIQAKKQSKSSEFILRSRTYLSKAFFKVELPALISFIDMAKKMVAVIESLQSFKKNLSAKLLIIEQEILNRPRVLKEKAKKERIVEVFVAEVELKMLLLSTYARSIFFSKQRDDQQITIDALAIGMAKKMDVRLGQFKNEMVTTQFPLGQKYKGIKDTHLILQIGRQSKQKPQSIPQGQNRSKKRIQRRLNFFQKIEKEKSSLLVIIKNKMDIGTEKKQSKSFRFDKARKNSVIEQQKKLKEINVLPLQVYLHAGNIAFLLLHKKQIENTMEQVSKVFRQIQEQSKEIIEQQRRDSIQSEGQVTTQINLKLKDLRLNIDIKPDFKYESQSGLRILSNSRMFVNLRIQQLDLTTNPDSSISKINNGFLSLNAYFLHFLDKDIEINPLLLNYQELQSLGFIKFIEMNELSLKLSHNARMNSLEIFECGIDIIKIDLCLSTIPLIQIFLDHFIKHSLNGNYGGVEEEQFVVLDNEGSEEQLPEDLTEKLDQYNDLILLKRQTFNDFSIRQFSIRQSQPTIVALKHFKIGSIKIKLFGGNDFNFIEVNSLYQSKASMRSRKETVDRMSFFSIDMINIRAKFQKNTKVSQMVLELEKMEVVVSFKRKEGLLWGTEKDCLLTLLKINMPLKIMADISEKYMMLKLSSLELTANLTDQILPLVNQFSKAINESARSPWKRHYKEGKIQQSKIMILLILPEGRITASAEIKRAKLLNQRILKLPTLVVHEQGSNGGRINRIIYDWAMQIFTNNLGTLLTGALFELVAACIGLLLGGIKQFLALFFPSLNG